MAKSTLYILSHCGLDGESAVNGYLLSYNQFLKLANMYSEGLTLNYKCWSASRLRLDKHFTDASVEYGLSSSEGVNTILSCCKIGKEYDGTEVIIYIREQANSGVF